MASWRASVGAIAALENRAKHFMEHKVEAAQVAAQFLRGVITEEELRAKLIEIDHAYKDEANVEDLFAQ